MGTVQRHARYFLRPASTIFNPANDSSKCTLRSGRPSPSFHVTVAALDPCISTASTSTGPPEARPEMTVPGVSLSNVIGEGIGRENYGHRTWRVGTHAVEATRLVASLARHLTPRPATKPASTRATSARGWVQPPGHVLGAHGSRDSRSPGFVLPRAVRNRRESRLCRSFPTSVEDDPVIVE